MLLKSFELMRKKLGLRKTPSAPDVGSASTAGDAAAGGDEVMEGRNEGSTATAEPLSDSDKELLLDLLDAMQRTGADYTNTFRALMAVDPLGADLATPHGAGAGSQSAGSPTVEVVVGVGGGQTVVASGAGPDSQASDPVLSYILTQLASVAEMAEASKPTMPIAQLLMLQNLAAQHEELASHVAGEMAKHEAYKALKARPESAKKEEDVALWTEWLSRYRARLRADVPPGIQEARERSDHAAHAQLRALASSRLEEMTSVTPQFILRNWIAHQAIKQAEEGDFTEVRRVLALMTDPYGRHLGPVPAGPEAGLAYDAAMSHQDAPNTALEGSSHLPAPSAGPCLPVKGDACGSTGGASGRGDADLARYTERPPPWALDLKVT